MPQQKCRRTGRYAPTRQEKGSGVWLMVGRRKKHEEREQGKTGEKEGTGQKEGE